MKTWLRKCPLRRLGAVAICSLLVMTIVSLRVEALNENSDPQAQKEGKPVAQFEPLDRDSEYTSRRVDRYDKLFLPITLRDEIRKKLRTATRAELHSKSKSRQLYKLRRKSRSEKTDSVIGTQKIRLLEFGIGQGVALMQLSKEFPELELFGINRRPWERPHDEVLKETALYHKVCTQSELADLKLPTVYGVDCSKGTLPMFENASFDIVISQVSVYMVPRKDLLLEEFWRILKPNGVALVEAAGIVVMGYDGNSQAFTSYIKEVADQGYDVREIFPGKIVMRKNTDRPLSFHLEPYREKHILDCLTIFRNVTRSSQANNDAKP